MTLCAWNYLLGRHDLVIFYEKVLVTILDCNYKIEWSTTIFNEHGMHAKNLVRQIILSKEDLDEVKTIKTSNVYNQALQNYNTHLMKGVSRNNSI